MFLDVSAQDMDVPSSRTVCQVEQYVGRPLSVHVTLHLEYSSSEQVDASPCQVNDGLEQVGELP